MLTKQILRANPAPCHPKRTMWAREMCKSCYDAWLKSVNPEYKEKQRASNKAWIEKNKERAKASQKRWRAKQDPSYNRRKQLAKYNLSLDDYDELLAAQNGKCAICLKSPAENKNLNVDHCHTTGKVRGLLCFRCNFGLSYFAEDYENLTRAAEHVKGVRNDR